jgi:hypothetical protein
MILLYYTDDLAYPQQQIVAPAERRSELRPCAKIVRIKIMVETAAHYIVFRQYYYRDIREILNFVLVVIFSENIA